jgi:hypothetical protein
MCLLSSHHQDKNSHKHLSLNRCTSQNLSALYCNLGHGCGGARPKFLID